MGSLRTEMYFIRTLKLILFLNLLSYHYEVFIYALVTFYKIDE